MTKKLPYFLLSTLLFLLLHSTSSFADTNDVKQIKQVYATYRFAILNDSGSLAFQCVDSRTREYYGRVLQWVLKDDSIALEKHSLVDKFTVLAIRAKAKKEELLALDSSGIFIFAVNKGMVGKNGVAKQEIAEPVVDSTFGRTALLVDGKESSINFHYYKEDNQWKIDITSLLTMANATFRNMVDESAMTENEFIMDILRILEGRVQDASIWLPVSK